MSKTSATKPWATRRRRERAAISRTFMSALLDHLRKDFTKLGLRTKAKPHLEALSSLAAAQQRKRLP